MATNETKPASEEAKMDLFEDDDEFEEFEIDLASTIIPQIKKEQQDAEESKVSITSLPMDSSLQLCPLCKNMDAKSLRLYLIEHVKEQKPLHEKVLSCLRCARDPGKLVFDVMHEFFLEKDGTEDDAIKSRCNFVIEQLMKLPPDVAPTVKEEAINFANLWKSRLTDRSKPSHVFDFLKFLVAYGLASSFDAVQLLSLFETLYNGDDIYEPEQNPSLCRALGLEAKIPDLIEILIEGAQERLVAVRYICAFNLVDKFPPVPLLEAHLEHVNRSALKMCKNFKYSIKAQTKCANRQILALQEVINCVMDFKLVPNFSPIHLQQHIRRLEKGKEQLESSKVERGKAAKNSLILKRVFNFQLDSKLREKRVIYPTNSDPQWLSLQYPEKRARMGDVHNVVSIGLQQGMPSSPGCVAMPTSPVSCMVMPSTMGLLHGNSFKRMIQPAVAYDLNLKAYEETCERLSHSRAPRPMFLVINHSVRHTTLM